MALRSDSSRYHSATVLHMVREDATQPAVLFAVTDVRTSVARLVIDDAVAIGWRLGSYVACCGVEVLALAYVRCMGDLR